MNRKQMGVESEFMYINQHWIHMNSMHPYKSNLGILSTCPKDVLKTTVKHTRKLHDRVQIAGYLVIY